MSIMDWIKDATRNSGCANCRHYYHDYNSTSTIDKCALDRKHVEDGYDPVHGVQYKLVGEWRGVEANSEGRCRGWRTLRGGGVDYIV